MYFDVGSSRVVGNQVTDLLQEVDYKREGRGSYYFEPTRLQYIKLRKTVIDITWSGKDHGFRWPERRMERFKNGRSVGTP